MMRVNAYILSIQIGRGMTFSKYTVEDGKPSEVEDLMSKNLTAFRARRAKEVAQ